MRTNPRQRWLLACLMLLAGCAQNITPTPATADRSFPVVKPFDLTRAGAKVEADFSLPNTTDNGYLRPVFVGFRSPGPKGRPDAGPGVLEYLDTQPMPFRIRLWKLEAGKRIPVVLSELQEDSSVRPPRVWYEAHPVNTFVHHGGAGQDVKELYAIGQFDFNLNYLIWDIARITPPTPGRYHIEIESLQDHPQVAHLNFELLVSHYFEIGLSEIGAR
ncbi:hypothetical protein [Pseudoxanthomonas dokdonensis]|uniref:DUF5625 domain-containing protein n=1 Tax=Pseudoxanthomonas dokdonensis TaxID=344882 RepID=A0A0R0CKZ0_9GAMM|nr:hypothetical protein [Pseudoxanthomonas dokdonensis]KRG70038.1 hypothetical protein ABB29_07315 [Pseudoxanthomonas dokdonensis]